MGQKRCKIIFIALAIIIAPQIALAAWWNPFSWDIWQKIYNWLYPREEIVCTQESKMCPDGSYVSREGPGCEYKPCPMPIGEFDNLNKDELLHKIFPNLIFKNGVADLRFSGIMPYKGDQGLKLYLKDSIEDYFLNDREKSLLLVVQLDGVDSKNGFFHAYLGLFDKTGKLLSPISLFPASNFKNTAEEEYYEFDKDEIHFGGDVGQFYFYNCDSNGIKYIFINSIDYKNNTCGFGKVRIFRIWNGHFENIQTIDRQTLSDKKNKQDYTFNYGLKMAVYGDKIIAKKVPSNSSYGCPEINYKELLWDKDNCIFEEQEDTSSAEWKHYYNSEYGFEFKYPEISKNYIFAEKWPPIAMVEDNTKNYFCPKQNEENINSDKYCIKKTSQAIAGISYISYHYATVKNGRLIIFAFTMGFKNCLAYSQKELAECRSEQDNFTFELNQLIDQIISNFKFID